MLKYLFKKTNYLVSNKITKVKFPISERAKNLAAKILQNDTDKIRQELSDDLLDELADLAKIDIVKLKISEEKQLHKKRNGRLVYKRYGYYKPGEKYIHVNNRTAVRGKILSSKTFLDTLLHEWMHHYDFCKLGLNSIHTAGFYKRLGDLKIKLDWPKN